LELLWTCWSWKSGFRCNSISRKHDLLRKVIWQFFSESSFYWSCCLPNVNGFYLSFGSNSSDILLCSVVIFFLYLFVYLARKYTILFSTKMIEENWRGNVNDLHEMDYAINFTVLRTYIMTFEEGISIWFTINVFSKHESTSFTMNLKIEMM